MTTTTQSPSPAKNAPPVIGHEQVRAPCGHAVPFPLFAPKQDNFRDERRKKVTERKCSDCRQCEAQERTQKEMAEATERRLCNPRPRRSTSSRLAASDSCGRLPDASEFSVSYCAESLTWSGKLTVILHGKIQTLSDTAGAVFVLLGKLDQQYREWLKQEMAKVANPQ